MIQSFDSNVYHRSQKGRSMFNHSLKTISFCYWSFLNLGERGLRSGNDNCAIWLNNLFTFQLMMLVDYAGSIFPIIAHVPWNGVHLADFVMPFFLFIAGVSVAIVYKVIVFQEFKWEHNVSRRAEVIHTFLTVICAYRFLFSLQSKWY